MFPPRPQKTLPANLPPWLTSGRQIPARGLGGRTIFYKLAEKKMLENARDQDILGKTKENANLIFKPMLENITGKKVGITFK